MYCGWTRCMMWLQSCCIYWDLFCSLPVMYPGECSMCTWKESILFPESPLQGSAQMEFSMLIFSCKNSKITTHCWTTINRRMLDSTKKDTPHPRAKKKPQQDGRRGNITFRIIPHIHQRCSEGSNKCVNQDQETPQRLSQNCVWVSPAKVWMSSGLLHGQGLWVK